MRVLRNLGGDGCLITVGSVPAWATNRLKRLARTPKRYAIDPGLVGAALQVDAEGVLRDGALAGRVLDTFVMNQVRAELHASDQALRAYRLRLEGGRHEFDLLLETPDGRLIAIEVKVEAAPSTSSARHLSWLRGEVNDRFVVGMILHTGPRSYVLGDRLLALPSAVCGREGASRQRFDGTGDELAASRGSRCRNDNVVGLTGQLSNFPAELQRLLDAEHLP